MKPNLTIALRIDEDQRRWLEAYAKKNDLSMSQVVRRALRQMRRAEIAREMIT